jgi:hypothetical protein
MRQPRFTLLRALPSLCALGLAVGCASNTQPAAEGAPRGGEPANHQVLVGAPFEWSKTLGADARVDVYGILGTVVVEPASGDTLAIRATKSGRGDLEAVTIEVVEAGERVIVCAVYPGGRCDENGYHGRHEGTIEVQVDLALELPAARDLTAHTVNGSVVAKGLTGGLEVETVNGNIELNTTGPAAAKTVNGSIVAELPRGLREDLRLKTVNGTLRVELPASVDADVSAATVNGGIESSFPLDVSHRVVGGRASGRLGRGGPQLELDTVNGSIRIHEVDRA